MTTKLRSRGVVRSYYAVCIYFIWFGYGVQYNGFLGRLERPIGEYLLVLKMKGFYYVFRIRNLSLLCAHSVGVYSQEQSRLL